MPPYTNVGTTGHWRFQLSISELGKTFSQRGSWRFGSASAFSLIIESYWSIESSSVFELSTTSRPKNSAHFRTPGIFESAGCQLSAATPFSEDTHTPSGVSTQSDMFPSVVLCEDMESDREASYIANRLAESVAEPIHLMAGDVVVTTSIGVAIAKGFQDSAETLVRDADAALYRAKERGRARHELFDHGMRSKLT